MQNTISKVVLIIGLAVGILTLSMADIPKQINIQGQLTDPTGVPLNGVYTCTFSLYSLPTGGSYSYQESFSYLTVQNGIFNYSLGSNGSLGLAFGTTYWLGIKIGTDTEMSPRTPIVSVGNAYKALNSDTSSTSLCLYDAGSISIGTIQDGRIPQYVARTNQANNWTVGTNTFNTPVSVSTIQNISGSPLSVTLDNSLNVKFPKGSYVTFGLDSDDNKEVLIGTGPLNGPRPVDANWERGILSLLGPDASTTSAAHTRMRLYHYGSAGIIDTDTNGGSIIFWPFNYILLKSLNAGVIGLPIGIIEVCSTGTNAAYQDTGTFGCYSALGGTINFSTAGYRSLTNTNYDVHIQPYLADTTIALSSITNGYSTVVCKKDISSFYYKVFQSGTDVTATVPVSWRIYYYQ